MSLKNLFFKDEEGDKKPKQKKVEKKAETDSSGVKFPESNSDSFPKTKENLFDAPTEVAATSQQINQEVVPLSCQPYIEDVIAMYQRGFDELNQAGYDFYEFFQAVESAGIDNAQAYQMAFRMAQSMGTGVNKQKLIDQSKFYIDEIMKNYHKYVEAGNAKRTSLVQQKAKEEESLNKEVRDLETEITRLTNLLQKKKADLSSIDKRYNTELQEVDCKCEANQIAKDKIIADIEKVVQGIGNNVQ